MFTKRNIPWLLGTIIIVGTAFVFLTKSLDWKSIQENVEKQVSPALLENERPEKRVDLAVSVSLSEQELAQFELLASKVQEDLPHIHVSIYNQRENAYTQKQWEEQIQIRDTGDIHLIPNEWVLPLAIQGYYRPVDRVLSSEVLVDQLASVIDRMKWNGNLWAVPYELNPYLIIQKRPLNEDHIADEAKVDFLQDEAVQETEEASNDNLVEQTNESTGTEEEIEAETETEAVIETEDGAVEVVEQSEAGHQEQEILWELMLDQYVGGEKAPLINFSDDDFSALWVFVQDVGRDQHTSISAISLNDIQKDILSWLAAEQNSGWSHNTIDSLLSLEEDQPPYFILLSWDEYILSYEGLKQYYAVEEARSPIPWLGGLSFAIHTQSSHNEEAGKWIEKMNLYATYYAMDIQRVPLRASFFTLANFMSYEKVLHRLYEKPLLAQQMSITTNWAEQLETMKQLWLTDADLNAKIEHWIQTGT